MAPSNPNRREPVICAECGAENRPSRFFCGSCGAYLRNEEDTWEGEAVTSTYRTDPLPSEEGAPGAHSAGTSAGPAGAGSLWASPPPASGTTGRPDPSEQDWLDWERSAKPRRSARYRNQGEDDPPPASTRALATAGGGRRRHGRGAGLLAAVFLLVAVAALFALVYSALNSDPSGEVATGDEPTITTAGGPETTTSGEQPGQGEEQPSTTTTEQLAENPEPITPGDVDASTELETQQGNSYKAENVIDGELDTSWQEGASGTGEGQWLRFTFDTPLTLLRLEIANGYQKDDERYNNNARPRQLRIEYSDGTSQMAELEDAQGYQSVRLSPKGTDSLTLHVESVYPGERWEDMAISEIRLYEAAAQ